MAARAAGRKKGATRLTMSASWAFRNIDDDGECGTVASNYQENFNKEAARDRIEKEAPMAGHLVIASYAR